MKLNVKIAGIFAVVAFALTAVAADAAFTRDLTLGSTGADVTELQTVLESKGYLTIPAGTSKGYFGALTKAAVIKWQTAVGLPATGYFGPMSRAKIAETGTTTGGSTTGSTTLKGDAGDLTITERSSGTEDKVLEGDEDVPVLGFEAEAEGSDIAVTSVKVKLQHTSGTGSTKLGRYIDSVSIMQGDEVVGTADAADFTKNGSLYTKSINVSKAVVDQDEKSKFYVAVTAVGNIDSTDLGDEWTATVDQTRFEDATGAVMTDNTDVPATFSFEDLASQGNVELTVEDDDQTINDAHTVEVSDTSDTNGVEILSFVMKAEGSDLAVQDLSIDLTSSGAGVTEIANDFVLYMGDEEVGTVALDGNTFASSSDTTRTLSVTKLDDDDVVIEEGDEASFTLKADINDIEGGFSNGDTLSADLNADDVNVEDINGDKVQAADLKGSAASNNIGFASTGLMLSNAKMTATEDIRTPDSTTDNRGVYSVTFDVEAFSDTAYIALNSATRGTVESNTGVNYLIQDQDNGYAATTTGTIASSILSRVSGGTIITAGGVDYVKVNAGQTVTLKLDVQFDSALTDDHRLQMYSVNFADTAVGATTQYLATPDFEYRTSPVSVTN